MTAIQRWYFYPLEEHGEELRKLDGNEFHDDEQWCKAKDVAELEKLMLAYIGTIAELRTEVMYMRQEKEAAMQSWSTACIEREALRTELHQVLGMENVS